jgi:hypothetical protein
MNAGGVDDAAVDARTLTFADALEVFLSGDQSLSALEAATPWWQWPSS